MSNYREISISDSDLSLKRPLEASHDPPSEKSILSQFAQKLHSAPNSCPAVAKPSNNNLSKVEEPNEENPEEDFLSQNRFYLNDTTTAKKIANIPASIPNQSSSIRPSNRRKKEAYIKNLYNPGQELRDQVLINTNKSQSTSIITETSDLATIPQFSQQITKPFAAPIASQFTSNPSIQVYKQSIEEMNAKIALLNSGESSGPNDEIMVESTPKTEKEASYQSYSQKYAPHDILGLYSNRSQAERLQNWLRPYSDDTNPTFFKDSKNKVALISGPPGVGKTTTARIIPQSLGLRIIELNASDCRNKSYIQEKILPFVSNTSIISTEKVGKSVLIMDEVDGMSAGDEGGIAALIECIKITKVPIICICNDAYSTGLKSLKNYCLEIKFVKANERDTFKLVKYINEQENLNLKEREIELISMYSKGDFRFCLNILEFCRYKFHLTSQKDSSVTMNSFETLHHLLSGTKSGSFSLEEKVSIFLEDYDFLMLLLTENYLEVVQMEDMVEASISLAFADIIMNKIKQEQEWTLLVDYAHMSLLCMSFSNEKDVRVSFGRKPVKAKKDTKSKVIKGKQPDFNPELERENELSILMAELSKII